MELIFKCTWNFLIIIVVSSLRVRTEIPPAPVLINITQAGRTSAVMQWSSPHQNNARTPVKSYEILYYPSGVPSQVKRMTMASRNNGKQGVRFTNLSPNTRYVVKLRAVGVTGEGPWISRNFTTLPYADPAININPDDQRKQEASDVIFVPPVINFKPTDQKVFEGSTVILPCEATGFPTPNITWVFNGDPIPIENGYLVLHNVRHGRDDGRYTCVATSKAGTVSTSVSLLIFVQVAVVAPSREYIFSLTSQKANLSCYGRGYPLPNVTWTKNGLPVSLTQKDKVINETFIESRLNLETLTIDKAGRYSCHVDNGVYGQEPSSVAIDVFLRPVINVKPNDQKVFEGSTIILPCGASGFPTPNITWLFNDDPIPWEHSIENDSLVLHNVRYGRHNGRHTCVATSKAGTVSTSATLLVFVKVTSLVSTREYIFSQTSQRANLSCYGRGYPLPNITWTKNGLPVSLTQTDRVINDTFIESRLNLGHLTIDKAGRYSCIVGNGLDGQEPMSVAIETLIRPLINVKPTDRNVFEGSTVILPCEASGFPTPNITWLFNGDPIPFDHSIENDSLVLHNVRHGRHDGRYTCVATSKAGTVSTSASLLVYVRVSANVPTREYIFSLTSQGANISCYGRGYPLPNITWTKDGLPVSLNQTDRVINDTFIESRLNLGKLTIEKAGPYFSHVGNGVHGQETISVTQEVLLSPVINVNATDKKALGESTVILPCEASGFPTPNITWLFNDDPIPWDHSIENDSLVLNNVKRGRHDGQYTCVATSKAGTVSTSASLLVYDRPSSFAKKRKYVYSLIANDYVFLTCFGRGNPRPIIVWEKDGSPVSLNQTDIVINDTVVESRLHLGNFTLEKAGTYHCYVKTRLDGVYIPVPGRLAIRALFYPTIVTEPVERDSIEGATVVFECKTKGFPQPTITWLLNEKPIPFEHTINDEGSLEMENVRRNPHAGKYTCVATSEAGTALHFAWLFVDEPRNCAEVLNKRRGKHSGVYTINPDGRGAFKVYCDQKTNGGGWTVLQRRQDGSVDFYRGWHDYKNGFGDLKGEFWLGLDKIHRLTDKTRKRLRVDLGDHEGNSRYAEYDYFAVSGESSKYRLEVRSYTGTARDSLSYHGGQPFTTKDRDNDVCSISCNCAVHRKGAWWFKTCMESHLNGVYHQTSSVSYAMGVNWYQWKGDHYSLKKADMKLRPTEIRLK